MRRGGGAGGVVALRSPADAPSVPLILPLLLCAAWQQSFWGEGGGVGGWQAISDVMPAVQ